MNDPEIRARIRQAVGESHHPAGFTSRVKARLNRSTFGQLRPARLERPRMPWPARLGRAASLVGAILLVLLVASLALGVHLWVVNTRPNVPSTSVKQDPAVKNYQSLLSRDLQRYLDTPQYLGCYSFSDAGCVPSSLPVIADLQHWLSDLNLSQPPARFAALDGLMRRDLAQAIAAQNAFNTAFEAKDLKATNAADAASTASLEQLVDMARDILDSRQGTVAQYTAEVRLDRTYLVACGPCQRLLSNSQARCTAGQTQTCLDQIAATRTQVEVFMEHLVRIFAPDALTAKDAALQADLKAADRQLDAMQAALQSGDQAALQSGIAALHDAISRVESDAADIASSP